MPRSFLLTDALVQLAELFALVILPWWITSSGGVSAVAVYGASLAIAMLLAAPLASPFGDRICKARQIRLGLAAMLAIALALTLVAALGVFNLPLLIALAVLQALAAAFVDQARATILAELLAPDQLPAAIRLRKTCQSLSGIAGPLLAGLALGVGSVVGALSVYAVLLLFAIASATRIPARTVMAPTRRVDFAQWWQGLRTGMAAKWRMPMERGWTAVNFVVWIFQGPAVGILIPIKVHAMGLAGNWLGLCLGALSLGVLLGSVFGSQWLVQLFGRYRVRLGLGFCEGLALAVVGFATSPYLVVVGLALVGFCNASMALVGATHRALAIPQSHRVRVFAASSMSTQVAGAIGPALAGFALTHWSVNTVYTAFGLLMATSVLGFLKVPRLKEFFGLGHEEVVDWYAHQYPKIFK
ncbi:MAG: MFS transporter [Pseudomonadota bacterium]